jgi:Zn ribbon nucleic-acid-binding protein
MIEIISVHKLIISVIIFIFVYALVIFIVERYGNLLLNYWAKREYTRKTQIYECISPGQYCRSCKSENLEIIEHDGTYHVKCKKCGHQDYFGKELIMLFGAPLPKRIKKLSFKEKYLYLYKCND